MILSILCVVVGLDSELGEEIVAGSAAIQQTVEQRSLEAQPASRVVIEVMRFEDRKLSGWWSTDKMQAVGEEKLLERRKRNS